MTVNITDPSFQSVSDLSIELSLTHPALNELSAVLIPPVGSNLPTLTLFNNRTNSYGCDEYRSRDHRCEPGDHDQRHVAWVRSLTTRRRG